MKSFYSQRPFVWKIDMVEKETILELANHIHKKVKDVHQVAI